MYICKYIPTHTSACMYIFVNSPQRPMSTINISFEDMNKWDIYRLLVGPYIHTHIYTVLTKIEKIYMYKLIFMCQTNEFRNYF